MPSMLLLFCCCCCIFADFLLLFRQSECVCWTTSNKTPHLSHVLWCYYYFQCCCCCFCYCYCFILFVNICHIKLRFSSLNTQKSHIIFGKIPSISLRGIIYDPVTCCLRVQFKITPHLPLWPSYLLLGEVGQTFGFWCGLRSIFPTFTANWTIVGCWLFCK